MKVIGYQIRDSEDMLIVDLANFTVERQSPDGTILWREMFLDKKLTAEYVERMIEEGTVYGAVM
tara:strand:- start:513 stop:704 length:192 start_codon:yes stop_codon:yes gene_type:complete